MNLYLKLFFWTALPFGILMGLYNGMQHNVSYAVIAGLLQGSFFGLFMSLVLGTLHKFSTRNMDDSSLDQPKQYMMVDLAMSSKESFNKSLEALAQCGSKLKVKDRDRGYIEASTKMSWKSFGETISITISEHDVGKTHIEIESKPRLKATIVDYGKNKENVIRVAEFLQD